jgi:Arc/MetJ-type ribon-helix-helix transcriptional regulator
MVMGMATTKITVTLPDDQVKQIQSLVASGAVPNVSAFVKRAVDVALQDAAGWRAILDEAMQQTGGPLTAKERAWVDSLLPSRPKKIARKRKAA